MMAKEESVDTSVSFSMRMTIYAVQKLYPTVRNVSCEQVAQWRSQPSRKLVILDVRPEVEHRMSHIRGSLQVHPTSHPSPEQLNITCTQTTTVICYCSVGYRSSDMAKKLNSTIKEAEHTLVDVYNMEGGLFQWAIEGWEMVDEEGGVASRVHPYNAVWGKLLPGRLRARL